MSGANVLLTGSTGFTGQYLGNELTRRGYNVLGIGLVGEASSTCEFSVESCDLTSKAQISQKANQFEPEYVIHLAGISFAAENDPLSYFQVHVGGTLNLIESLDISKIKKIVFASTGQVYGTNNANEPLSENLCPSPNNSYSISKLAMEHCINSSDLADKAIITRPFNYTGPGQSDRFIIPKIVSHFKAGNQKISLGNVDVRRDFTSITDVVNAYVQLLECSKAGHTVNICSGRNYSISEVINYLEKKTGNSIIIESASAFIRKNEVKVVTGCNDKLSSLVNWRPKQSLFDVIDDMLQE